MKDEKPTEILGINRRNLDLVFADHRPGAFRELDDKILSKEMMKRVGVPTPRTLAVVRSSSELDELERVLVEHAQFVIKPARGWGGRGILVLTRDDSNGSPVWITPGGHRFDEPALFDHVDDVLSGAFSLDESEDAVIVEERIIAHAFLQELYPDGLSDLRIVLEDGAILQAMLRVPTHSSDGRANLHGGGLGLGIDLESGVVTHAVQGEVPVRQHPDTGVELIGKQVPLWDDCQRIALEVAEAVLPIRYLGVDIVLDARRGALVLEINARPGLAIQLANRAAQPARRRTRTTALDRFTQRTAWLVLLAMLSAPIFFARWHGQETTSIRAVRPEGESSYAGTEEGEEATNVEWSDESTPVSARSTLFSAARTAAAAGDTATALSRYEQAASDPSLAPFARNNIALIHRAQGDLQRARTVLESVVEQYPEYVRGTFNLSLVLRDLGLSDAAEQRVRHALELRPSHAGSWGELGELLAERAAWEEARDAFENSIRFDPDTVADRRRLAQVLLELGRPGAAAERFRQALALFPESGRAASGWVESRLQHAAMANEALATNTLDSLRTALEPQVSSRPTTTTDRRRAALFAELLWCAGDVVGAYDVLASLPPSRLEPRILQIRALLALELGLAEESAECLTSSDSRRLQPIRGMVELTRGPRPSAAVANASDALVAAARSELDRRSADSLLLPQRLRLALSPERPTAWMPTPLLLWITASADTSSFAQLDRSHPDFRPRLRMRFEAAARGGNAEEAHALGMRLLRTRPHDLETSVALVDLEIDRQSLDLARSLLEKLPENSRRRYDVRRTEARLLLAEGEPRSARRILRSLTKENSNDVRVFELLADANLRSNRNRAATEALDAALALEPGRPDLRDRLARTLMARGLYAEAAAQWQRLLTLSIEERQERSAEFNLALSLQREDRFTEAVGVWERYLSLSPENPRARFNRALALEELGRDEEAILGFREALALDPDHEPSRQHLDALVQEKKP